MGHRARVKRDRAEATRAYRFATLTDPAFAAKVRTQLLASGERINSCIGSTGLYVRLGRKYRIKVEALTVEAAVYNKVIADWIVAHDYDFPTRDVLLELGNRGGRFVVLGAQDTPDTATTWHGHLVAVVRAAGAVPHVVDLTIDQASRPEKGITITGPAILPVDNPAFLRGEVMAVRRSKSGMLISYQAFPDDRTFEQSLAWTDPPQVILNGSIL